MVSAIVMAFTFGCGDDDPAPMPMLDCSATGPTLSLVSTDLTGCGEDDGTIKLTIAAGTGSNAITIDPQPVGVIFDQSSTTFNAVEPGTYTIEVKDSDNCAVTENVTIGFPAASLSYDAIIKPIIEASCAVTACHDGTQTIPDFNDFATFQARANNEAGGVRQRVKTKDMPRRGDLTTEEIALILCWIDEGSQNN